MRFLLDESFPRIPWDLLDAVVFDIGNVLVCFDPGEIVGTLFPGDPELHTRILDRTIRTPYWLMLDRGVITYEEAEDAMSAPAPALRPFIHSFLANWCDLKYPIEEGVAALRAVHAHGKKVCLLSNYHRTAFDYIERKYDFIREADHRVISSHVNLLKPDPAIYRLLEAECGCAPARMLFIDDSLPNIESALFCGWQAILDNESGKLTRFMDLL